MGIQNYRIYLTLSPRLRKLLELCATFDGSTLASYAAMLLSEALTLEIEKHPALKERWVELEREALVKGSWDAISLPDISKEDEAEAAAREMMMMGWILSGDPSSDYECGIDARVTFGGKSSYYLRSKIGEATGFGAFSRTLKAEEYRNKRVRLSAQLAAKGVEDWAGLWMRVEGPDHQVLSFENMQSRPICGTSGWQLGEIVLDIPEESLEMTFGLLLKGPGQAWMNEIQLTEESSEVPLTSDIKSCELPNI